MHCLTISKPPPPPPPPPLPLALPLPVFRTPPGYGGRLRVGLF